jgi:hypothetical protein
MEESSYLNNSSKIVLIHFLVWLQKLVARSSVIGYRRLGVRKMKDFEKCVVDFALTNIVLSKGRTCYLHPFALGD